MSSVLISSLVSYFLASPSFSLSVTLISASKFNWERNFLSNEFSLSIHPGLQEIRSIPETKNIFNISEPKELFLCANRLGSKKKPL